MEAGLTNHIWSLQERLAALEDQVKEALSFLDGLQFESPFGAYVSHLGECEEPEALNSHMTCRLDFETSKGPIRSLKLTTCSELVLAEADGKPALPRRIAMWVASTQEVDGALVFFGDDAPTYN